MPYNIRRLDLTALPCSPTRGATLPDFPVLYIIFSDAEVFYVGATKSLFNRWSAHCHHWQFKKILNRKGVRVAWIKADINQLGQFESALISFLNPKLNRLKGNGSAYHHADIKRPNRRAAYHRLTESNGNGHR